MQSPVPFPGPDSPPRNEWSDWYASTEPSSPLQPADTPPTADQPPAYQTPAYEQAPMPYPGHQQPYPPPFEPATGAPSGPPGPFGPPVPPGPAFRPASGAGRSRAPLYWSALSVVVVAAVVLVLLLHPFSHHETISDAANKTPLPTASASVAATASTPSTSLSPSATAPASVSATAVTEQQAASNMAGMLASSVTDRTAINNAYNDVYGCGPNLHSDAAVFTSAASSRRTLLASLAAMPGRSTLPPALLSDLTGAWQASMSADQGFATWATDEVTQGCVRGDTSDPAYQTTIAPDNQATEDKTAFAGAWNPIAARYGLTAYQQDQL